MGLFLLPLNYPRSPCRVRAPERDEGLRQWHMIEEGGRMPMPGTPRKLEVLQP